MSAVADVLREIYSERTRQDAKWGEQNHPDGTGSRPDKTRATLSKAVCDSHARTGHLTWKDILQEEVAEAFAESDVTLLRAELVQVAAVAAGWIEAIDRRTERP